MMRTEKRIEGEVPALEETPAKLNNNKKVGLLIELAGFLQQVNKHGKEGKGLLKKRLRNIIAECLQSVGRGPTKAHPEWILV